MSKESKRCHNCRWFATADSGYSNYTVENTTVYCLRKLNPGLPTEESYSWYGAPDHPVWKFAESCEKYEFSDNPIGLDVDGEVTIEDWKTDTELYALAQEFDW